MIRIFYDNTIILELLVAQYLKLEAMAKSWQISVAVRDKPTFLSQAPLMIHAALPHPGEGLITPSQLRGVGPIHFQGQFNQNL